MTTEEQDLVLDMLGGIVIEFGDLLVEALPLS